jgi:D-serine dehydratase
MIPVPNAQSLTIDLDEVLSEPIDWRLKAWPLSAESVSIGAAPNQKWNVLDGDFNLPVLVLKESSLQHNIALMAGYCQRHHLALAPHAKTPVAPQIVCRQLQAGAWAITVANFHELRLLRHMGLRRILMANELLEREPIAWVAREMAMDPSFEFFCLVDSERGIQLMETHLAATGFKERVPVMVEMGVPGGRCGCRTPDEAVQVAKRVIKSPALRLAGVEAYEGMVQAESADGKLALVDALMHDMRRFAERLDQGRQLAGVREFLVTAGGSLFVDRVAELLGSGWNLSVPVRVVARCGAYVAHDMADNEEASPLAGRSVGEDHLQQALELWALVLSRPEPELAVVGFGKRDVAHDRGWPKAFAVRSSGAWRSTDDAELSVLSLNDQHARVRIDPRSPLQVGDQVGFHISHPCTTFDNWRLVPNVDDAYNVVEAVRCYL